VAAEKMVRRAVSVLLAMSVLTGLSGAATVAAADEAGFVGPPTVTRHDQATTFQLNATHDGAQESTSLIGELEERWRLELSYRGEPIWSTATAVANDTVLVASGVDDNVRGRHTFVTALDVHTGEVLWGPRKLQSGLTTQVTATIAGDMAYVVHSRGTMLALDLRSGQERWQVDNVGYSNNPGTVVDGALAFGAGGMELRSAHDGRLRWRSLRDFLDSDGPPAFDGRTLYASSGAGNARAVALDGTVRWDRDGDGSAASQKAPALHEGRLYIRDRVTDGFILDATDGRLLDRFSSFYGPAFHEGAALFTPHPPFSPHLPCCEVEAVDLTDGTVRWTSGDDLHVVMAPIVVAGTAWLATYDGEVHGLDARTGTTEQVLDVGGIIYHQDEHNGSGSRPGLLAGEGHLLVPSGNGLVAYAATAPAPSLSADAVRFVTQPPGRRSTSTTLSLVNTGAEPLQVQGSSLTGSSVFVVTDRCRDRQLAPSERCGIEVAAAPSTTGRHVASLALATSAGSVTTELAVEAVRFGDLREGPFLEDVYWALDEDVTRGCGDGGAFCPSQAVTRAQMASFLARALHLPPAEGFPPGRPQGWPDVTPGPHSDAIDRVAAAGITVGCGDGAGFCPARTVTRAQMASFLARALELEPTSSPFPDVQGPHAQSVGAVAAAGIARGCGDGTAYCPDRPVRRDQMAAFLRRALAPDA
jgi:outer membrane protein assembly factor BamB